MTTAEKIAMGREMLTQLDEGLLHLDQSAEAVKTNPNLAYLVDTVLEGRARVLEARNAAAELIELIERQASTV